MPSDTIYGIVGSALNYLTVKRIYKIKKRTPAKPCIILIGKKSELKRFGINLTGAQEKEIKNFWLKPVSIIFDCPSKKFSYLHRGTKTLAFRLPRSKKLRALLIETGPLIAPSANPEGMPPARNIKEAENYFGNFVDLFIDGGPLQKKASQIVRLYKDGSSSIIRK